MRRLDVAGRARGGRVACGFILAVLGVNAAAAACLQANTDDQVAQGKLSYVRIVDEAYARTELPTSWN